MARKIPRARYNYEGFPRFQSVRVGCWQESGWASSQGEDSNWGSAIGPRSKALEWICWVHDKGTGGAVQNWTQKKGNFEELMWPGLLERCVCNQYGGAEDVLQHTWRFLQGHEDASLWRHEHTKLNVEFGCWSYTYRLDSRRKVRRWKRWLNASTLS